MAGLTTEYTDVKNIKHKVEHLIVSAKEGKDKDIILEELFSTLVKPRKRILV